MTMTPINEGQALHLDFVRCRIRSLFSARLVGPWSAVEQADYDALAIEERLLLDAR
jgi:hypothetical protein